MIFNDTIVVLAADAPPGLFPAREQTAVSLGWHIILTRFGVAFPMMIFVMCRRTIRRNDPTALGLAKRSAGVRRRAGPACAR
jgi:cytochrome bd ubiquinol oxidase subunit I